MASILIAYGTTEGQTRKICNFLGDQLRKRGFEARVLDTTAATDESDPAAFDAIIVAGSVHQYRHQSAVADFVKRHLDVLNQRPNAFLSVSLAAVSDEERPGAHDCARAFLHETGWEPDAIELVPGALLYTEYDFFKRMLMKYIVRRAGGPTDTSRDFEFTDWDALSRFAAKFADRAVPAA